MLIDGQSLIGEPDEAEIHMKGLRQMMAMRGGIQHYTLDGVFLHMLCLYVSLPSCIDCNHTYISSVNHLTAVISENPNIVSPAGIPYKPKTRSKFTTYSSSHSSSSPDSSSSSSPSSTTTYRSPAETSPLLKGFATKIGFHPTVVDLLHDMEYLYFVVDAFTTKFMPEFREMFEDVVRSIESMCKLENERGKDWVLKRLKRWGEGEMLVRNTYKKGVHG